ncbi:MAG: protein jag [Lachnospiraceae bacterium]|nr:protein jag [Lachnospiraceae bacterium]
MEYIEISARTLDDAITEACKELMITSDKLEYVVVEEGSNGFLGLGSKQATIKAKIKNSVVDCAALFLDDVFNAMKMAVKVDINLDEKGRDLSIDLSGEDMGVLIGKRGQTLDSLQYLISLIVNKESEEYVRVKVDTENYRKRRKETLENLAKNIAFKVKRSRRPVSLEPMNPYERRIIHSILQGDKFVTTHSEGEEPFRRVVVTIKK